jgi:hypothetical protein
LVYARTGELALPDVVEHIFDAQRNLPPANPFLPTQTILSPGRYDIKAGTRAIREVNGADAYKGLLRDNISEDVNRKAACKLANSLWRLRPRINVEACSVQTSERCGCDEFPFASTRNGAFWEPNSTSVRGIRSTQNELGGSQFGKFVVRERLPPDPSVGDGDAFWVEIKNFSVPPQ